MLTESQITKFLDVDFGVAAAAAGRMMGCKPREEAPGKAGIQLYGDVRTLVPEKDWEELIRGYMKSGWPQRKLMKFVHDQNGEPSCTSNATLLQHAIKMAEQYGLDKSVVMSPISLYRFVGSPRSGSTLIGNMRRMITHGALPLDTPENRAKFKHVHPHNGYSKPLPAGAEETMALFRNAEYVDVDSWAEMVSALLCGHAVLYARAGHCILAVGLTITDSGLLTLDYANSWGDWGNAINEQLSYGLGHDSERTAKAACRGSLVLLNTQSPYAQAL